MSESCSAEIICAHRWREKATFSRLNATGDTSLGWWTNCQWCEVTWYDDRPEPRIVVGRIVPTEEVDQLNSA